MKTKFVWGLGGVGKSHICLREAIRASSSMKVVMMTLDPSDRLFFLAGTEPKEGKNKVHLNDVEFDIKKMEAFRLLETLDYAKKASPSLKAFYQKMATGLQEFSHYLSLIQLSREIEKSDYDYLIVDTPPLVEAAGLQRSLFHLKAFFETSLVQMALKTSRFSLIHFSLKKIFDLSRLFVGQKTTDRVFELFEWMVERRDQFEKAARFLDELVFSRTTEHVFVLTPDSDPRKLTLMKDLFSEAKNKSFLINRSVWNFPNGAPDDPFSQEMLRLKSLEERLLAELKSLQPNAQFERIPMILMGEDTTDELIKFSKVSSLRYE